MDPLSIGIGLGIGAGGAYATKLIREHRQEPQSLTEALGWAHLVDADKVGGGYAVIALKDGGLMRAWRYQGPDTSNATAREVQVLSRQINEALRPLGTGWLLDINAVRRGAKTYAAPDACHFPTGGLAFLDDLRRRRYASGEDRFETEYILCATYLAPKDVYSKLGAQFIEGRDAGGADWDLILDQYQKDTDALARRLGAQLSMEPLGPSELMTHLHETLTGKAHPVRYNPAANPYLAAELASENLVGGFKPKIGSKHVRVISLLGLPSATRPAHTHFLSQLPFSFRWHTRWMPYNRNAAEEEINAREKEWVRKRQGAKALMSSSEGEVQDEKLQELSRDQGSLGMLEGSAEAKALLSSGEVKYGRFTTTIVVMEESEERADHVASEIVGHLGEQGKIPAQVETVNATDAFFGSLPGHGSYNIRRPMISTRNVADLMPTTGIWPGEEENPSDLIPEAPPLMWAQTDGSTPFRVNLHDGDVGHAFCIGQTGAGKSVLVSSLAYQWMRYAGAQVKIFDVGYSHYLLSLLAGGEHYDLGGRAGNTRLQPLRGIDDPQHRSFAREWIELLFDVQGQPLGPEQKEVVTAAIQEMARMPPGRRTMLQLKSTLSDDRALQSVLSEYTASGSYGELLDSADDSIGEGDFQVFEIGPLMSNMGDEIVVPVLYYLFQLIEQQLSATRPTIIIIEEAWAALMKSMFADKLKTWLATLRKGNGAVFMVAHSPSQLQDDQIRNVEMLTENIPTRFFLPNPNALSKKAKPIYEDFGLNEREIRRLTTAKKKRDYYYSNANKGGRMFRLGLSQAELAFMGTAPQHDMGETAREARRIRSEHGEDWVAPWLRYVASCKTDQQEKEELLGQAQAFEHFTQQQDRSEGGMPAQRGSAPRPPGGSRAPQEPEAPHEAPRQETARPSI